MKYRFAVNFGTFSICLIASLVAQLTKSYPGPIKRRKTRTNCPIKIHRLRQIALKVTKVAKISKKLLYVLKMLIFELGGKMRSDGHSKL